jgi:hypothetical protein
MDPEQHAQHMAMMSEGLMQIKQIVDGLLAAEQGEAEQESQAEQGYDEQIAQAMQQR